MLLTRFAAILWMVSSAGIALAEPPVPTPILAERLTYRPDQPPPFSLRRRPANKTTVCYPHCRESCRRRKPRRVAPRRR